LALLVTVRIALPEAARRILVSQASKALQSQVHVGDVDLAFFRAGVALEDVAVLPPDRLPTTEGRPLIAWKRLAVRTRLVPLLWKTAQLKELALESPRVSLDRLETGSFNVFELVTSPPQAAAGADAEANASSVTQQLPPQPDADRDGWTVAIDRLVVRDGGLRFRDLMIEEAEPLDLEIQAIEMTDFALQPGTYDEPSHLRLELRIDEGNFSLDATSTPHDAGPSVDAVLKAEGLPLRHTRVYIPKVGWSDLTGKLDLMVAFGFEPKKRSQLRGEVALREVTVGAPGFAEPALAWEQLRVRVEPIDFIAERAAVKDVQIHGASLLLHVGEGQLLPLLARREEDDAQDGNAQSQDANASPTWDWSLSSLQVRDSKLRLVAPQTSVDVGVDLTAARIGSSTEERGVIDLTLTPPSGSLRLAGELRAWPPAFGGKLSVEDLELPELADLSVFVSKGLVQSCRLSANLNIEAGLPADSDGTGSGNEGGVVLSGSLALKEARLALPDPKDFSLELDAFDVAIKRVQVPGLLSRPDSPPTSRAVRIELREVHLAKPSLKLVRAAEGFVMPVLASANESTEAAAEPAPDSMPSETATARTKGVELDVERLRLTQGKVRITDRTLKPYFKGGLDPLDAELNGIRWPPLSISQLHAEATNVREGKIGVDGTLTAEGGTLKIKGRKIVLPPFNPYTASFAPYSIDQGRLSVTSEIQIDGRRYTTRNSVKLRDLYVKELRGDGEFEKQIGIPLSLALALLRDPRGIISLDVPLTFDERGTTLGSGALIRDALRSAVVSALTSPLKLIGAAVSGGKVKSLKPDPILFFAGRSELTPGGREQLEHLAAFLASRPAIAVRLSAAGGKIDERWLHEQALREEWEGQGLLGTLQGLTRSAAQERVKQALDARAKGEDAELAEEDAAALEEWLADVPPIPSEKLLALAGARLALVENELREEHGIDAKRIQTAEPSPELRGGDPAVRIKLQAIDQ
jgi:uncharacterized protein involved in outer membrane biogenesis